MMGWFYSQLQLPEKIMLNTKVKNSLSKSVTLINEIKKSVIVNSFVN